MSDLVPIFRTEDLALLPLAKLALEAEQIDYLVRGPGVGAEWTYATLGASSRNAGWVEIVVASDVAARARGSAADRGRHNGFQRRGDAPRSRAKARVAGH